MLIGLGWVTIRTLLFNRPDNSFDHSVLLWGMGDGVLTPAVTAPSSSCSMTRGLAAVWQVAAKQFARMAADDQRQRGPQLTLGTGL